MSKCNSYHESYQCIDFTRGMCKVRSECWGTRERDECSCGGDTEKCDFYPEKRKKSKIIAVDFDGTLCENKWPEIGEPNWELINYLREQKALGAKVILWTCREGQEAMDAILWCLERGLKLDTCNRNVPEIVTKFGGDCRKIYADEYIDDKMSTRFKLPFVKGE